MMPVAKVTLLFESTVVEAGDLLTIPVITPLVVVPKRTASPFA